MLSRWLVVDEPSSGLALFFVQRRALVLLSQSVFKKTFVNVGSQQSFSLLSFAPRSICLALNAVVPIKLTTRASSSNSRGSPRWRAAQNSTRAEPSSCCVASLSLSYLIEAVPFSVETRIQPLGERTKAVTTRRARFRSLPCVAFEFVLFFRGEGIARDAFVQSDTCARRF